MHLLRHRSKGKKKAHTEDNNNLELLAMLKEMKENMREMDEQIREEFR